MVAGDGTIIPFNNANAQIGVGDSTVAATPTQADLQGTNTAYVSMDAGYPMITDQIISFRSTFNGDVANFSWSEVSIRNSATGMVNLNRKVQAMGTKAAPAIWSVTLQVTLT